ncbi:MAG: hypothetical protein AAF690_26220 [Acidobacteriota bacterium]
MKNALCTSVFTSLLWIALAASAGAATGDLEFVDCFGSETNLTGANCTATTEDALRALKGVSVTRDGRDVYAAATDNSVAHFRRDATNGELTFVQCWSGNASIDSCDTVPTTALNLPTSIDLSSDDGSVYVVARDALLEFEVLPDRSLRYVQCWASNNRTGFDCSLIGADVLNDVSTVRLSPDGSDLYVVSTANSGGIGHFSRATSGALTFVECFSSEPLQGCVDLIGTTNAISAMDPIVFSPDGRSLYTASERRDALIHFARSPSTGVIGFAQCWSSDAPDTTGCVDVAEDLLNRIVDTALAVSPDGRNLYAAGFPTQSLLRFDRAADGSLVFVDCITGTPSRTPSCELSPNQAALNNVRALTVSPDGQSLYVGGRGNSVLSHFSRRSSDGALSFRECFSSSTSTNHGCQQVASESIEQIDQISVSPDGTSLYASGLNAISHYQRETSFCQPNATTMCLNEMRFEVRVTWRDFRNDVGDGRVVDFSADDSGIFYFFAPDNFEMLIKVLDACPVNGRFWVFLAAVTDVEYTVAVRDTDSGVIKEYFNPLGNAAPAVADTDAFATCPASRSELTHRPQGRSLLGRRTAGQDPLLAPEIARHRPDRIASGAADRVDLSDVLRPSVPVAESSFVASATAANCEADDTTLCLNDGRFRVEVAWRDFQDNRGVGRVVPFGSTDSGLFYFFAPDNVEILLKVLDACSFSSRFWFFAAATTTVEYTLTVTDTQTGDQKTYFNPLDNAARAITDTQAFDTCN